MCKLSSFFNEIVMEAVITLSLDSISLYLSYEKIHRTDITLWKPPVQMLNTKETTGTTCCSRLNSICAMNFFRRTDTTDTTIRKPGFRGRYFTAFSWNLRSRISRG